MAAHPEQHGLRERKKRETRQRIHEVAVELFADRGFDRVTVTEIAHAANVSQATVFNYFPTKEDLIFQGMAEYERTLVAALAARPPGTPILDAFRDHLLQPRGALANSTQPGTEAMLRIRRIIAGSPSLQARELLISNATADELATLIANGPPESVQPRFLAMAMIGVTQAIAREIHRLAASGLSGPEITALVFPQGADAIAILEQGLAATSMLDRSSPAPGTSPSKQHGP